MTTEHKDTVNGSTNTVIAGKGDNYSIILKIFCNPEGNYIIFDDILMDSLRTSLLLNGYDIIHIDRPDFEADKSKPTAVFVKPYANYDSSKETKKEYSRTVERIIRKVCSTSALTNVIFFNCPVPVDNYFVKSIQRNMNIVLVLDSYSKYAECNGSDRMRKILENTAQHIYTGGLGSKDDKYLVRIFGKRSSKLNRKE